MTLTDNSASTKKSCPLAEFLLLPHGKIMQDYPYDENSFEDEYLIKLRNENEILMKKFDDIIGRCEKQIKKTTEQLARMNHNLQQMMTEKEKKQNEFIQFLNEHKRSSKMGRFNQKRQKSVKRMKLTA